MLKPHFSIATIYRLILMILLASGGASDRLQAAEIDPSQVPSATGQSTQTGSPQPTEIYVFGEQPVSTATEASVRQKDFELRPTGTPVDILTSSVPGLYTVQHQGGGKADEYLIRGFDADHGTDFAIFVDGIPVNMSTTLMAKATPIFTGSSRKSSTISTSPKDPISCSMAISPQRARSISLLNGGQQIQLQAFWVAATACNAT